MLLGAPDPLLCSYLGWLPPLSMPSLQAVQGKDYNSKVRLRHLDLALEVSNEKLGLLYLGETAQPILIL